MAVFKYFDPQGRELASPGPMRNQDFAARFPGVRGVRYDGYSKWTGYIGRDLFPVVRVIEFSARPSLHKCDARCQNAKGRKCECSCLGKNHGAGSC